LSVSSERAGEDRLAADLDRFLELQIHGRGSERPGQPEAGDGEGAGLEETAACCSASRCHGETSDSEWDRDDWFSEGGKSKRARSPRRHAPSPTVSRRCESAAGHDNHLALHLALQEPPHRGGRLFEGHPFAHYRLDLVLSEPSRELLDVPPLALRIVLRPFAPIHAHQGPLLEQRQVELHL